MATAHAHKLSDAHGDAHNAGGSIGLYLFIFAALLILLFASVALAYVPTHSEGSRDWLTVLGYSIATAKALLIIFFFMHVKYGSKLTMIFSLGSFFFLFIMFGLTLNDYLTRNYVVQSEQAVFGPSEPSGSAEGYKEPAKDYPAHSDSNYGR